MCLTVIGLLYYVIQLNGSADIGVLVGGFLGLLYLSALMLSASGAIWGFIRVRSSATEQ